MKFHEHAIGLRTSDHNAMHVLDATESRWIQESRPYYKVYPCITDALQKINLDISISTMSLASRVVLIRFAAGNEPSACGVKTRTVLTEVDNRWLIMFAQQDWGSVHIEYHNAFWFDLTDKRTYEESIAAALRLWRETIAEKEKSHGISNSNDVHDGVADLFGCAIRMVTKIALTCHLLADDPSIITPDVLSSDRDRYESEKDEAWKQRAVDRARRRGVVGWNIGADYEVCPHYRRPHFGLRHTGKGKTVPRIVPIKGAVVHRSRLTEVPTGYMLPDGTEVEHGKVVQKNS